MKSKASSSSQSVPITGQRSWRFSSDLVDAAVTETGGQLAPVRFRLGKRVVEPYSIAPWAEEAFSPKLPGVLQALRGDFFCAPFGGNDAPFRGERHPVHGEVANAKWKRQKDVSGDGYSDIHLSLKTKIRAGRIDKWIHVRGGETAVYCRHVFSGMGGPMCFGHHAMLRFPDQPGSGIISTSPIRHAQVFPGMVEEPANKGYSSLKPGATFRSLDRVPSVFGGTVDAGRYPARRGFEDLFLVIHQAEEDFAWTAVAFPEQGYLWYALKDPRLLQSTVFWVSNGGRHYAPWNGRHVNVMGIEDVTAYFHLGLADSARKNPLNEKGYNTALTLRKNTPLAVNYIMGVAAIPRGFTKVKTIRRSDDGITITSTGGRTVHARVDSSHLHRR